VIDYGIIILAGGQASRLPGKLELATGELPMLVRVYRNISGGRPTYISCNGSFSPATEAQLPCPMIVDRWPARGPLAGILSTMSEMRERFAFVVAGDAPHLTASFVEFVAGSYRDGDEALVPRHAQGIEPLAALYDRDAFLREGLPLLRSGNGAPRAVIERLQTRYIDVDDPAVFASVNTPDDYSHVRASFA
jgi:molybdopterin-guanine dinucleotide biosynthesis protein A